MLNFLPGFRHKADQKLTGICLLIDKSLFQDVSENSRGRELWKKNQSYLAGPTV